MKKITIVIVAVLFVALAYINIETSTKVDGSFDMKLSSLTLEAQANPECPGTLWNYMTYPWDFTISCNTCTLIFGCTSGEGPC